MLLVATRRVQAGDELTFSYLAEDVVQTVPRQLALLQKWRFRCTCAACTDVALTAKLVRIRELDVAIEALARAKQYDDAVARAEQLVAIYDEVGCLSHLHYVRVYHDMYQICIAARQPRDRAMRCLQLAIENETAFYGGVVETANLFEWRPQLAARRLLPHD